MAIQWNTWEQVKTALNAQENNSLLVVCVFVQSWFPPSLRMVEDIMEIKESGVASFADIFVLDADAEIETSFNLGVRSTPSLVLYWKGKPMILRRCDRDDHPVFVGSLIKDHLLDLLRYARDSRDQPNPPNVLLVEY
eukprot:GCRY01001133.1.p1 GENE.GCRY01001133.1~~GCRY01001133.1.p1  ORF type:complete len:137 (-),score=24.67 GCRY01001133.1:305-715(-)